MKTVLEQWRWLKEAYKSTVSWNVVMMSSSLALVAFDQIMTQPLF